MKTTPVTVRLADDLVHQLDRCARREHRSRADMVRMIVMKDLKERQRGVLRGTGQKPRGTVLSKEEMEVLMANLDDIEGDLHNLSTKAPYGSDIWHKIIGCCFNLTGGPIHILNEALKKLKEGDQ